MPSYSALTDRFAVERALEESDRLGRDAFLRKYGFGPARDYFLVTETGRYDSKAIFGAAFGFQHGTPLASDEFSGGRDGAAGRLAELGFTITGINTKRHATDDIPERRRLIQRVEVPAAAPDAWEWALGLPYRCIADPSGPLIMPAAPDSIPDDHENWERRHRQQLAYYTTLQSFLTYSLGWTRHDKGLLWWYENRRPTDDPRLALVRDVWLLDGTLSGYIAWFLERMGDSPDDAFNALRPWLRKPDYGPATPPDHLSDKLRQARREGVWSSGYDPLHLWGGHHAGAPSGRRYFGESDRPPARARLLGTDTARRSATLLVEGVDGWYAQLATLGDTLPTLFSEDWSIEVFVKPIGYTGSYRRSSVTGLWFTGRHRYHVIGN